MSEEFKAFVSLAARTREAQKIYYSTPSYLVQRKAETLQQAKDLEHVLDAEIKRIRKAEAERQWQEQNPMIPGL